ncbi:MAG: sulfotransferase [Leptolyngbyaceae cyanobacterium]
MGNWQIERAFFIVGCPRSGTTLLQQMLDAHPEVAVAPETHFMRLFWNARDEYGDLTEDHNYQQLLDKIIALPEFLEMELDAQEFLETAWHVKRTYAVIFQLLLEKFAHRRSAKIIGEKTPNHVLYMPAIQTLFPNARFIHIVRDPRSVVNSWRSVPWSKGTVTGDAEMWRYYVSAAQRKPPSEKNQLFTLHYEKLVLEPERTLRSLCQFLDLEFEPVMLDYHQKQSNLVNTRREPWKGNAVKPVSQDSLIKWQKELSHQEVAEIESIVWFEMQRLGYKPQTHLISVLPTLTQFAISQRFKRITNSIKYRAKKVVSS